MSLRTQFKSLLEPEVLETLVDQTLPLKLIRYVGSDPVEESITLGPFPPWFTLYEVKLALWNAKDRDPAFAAPLVFFGIPKTIDGTVYYTPMEMVWMSLTSSTNGKRDLVDLLPPISLMGGSPDTRFVDSAGGQKAIGKENRIRMTLNDVFQLEEGKTIPEMHVFLYADLIDRIVGPRPLGERDAYGRIMPYFPFLDPLALPLSPAAAVTSILISHADQTRSALKQALYLEELLQTLGGDLQMPKLDGVKFLRWVWNQIPDGWEGPAVLFFGTKVTHDRPYMRFFSSSGQPLTKIRVKGVLPIPDLPDTNLLLTWKQDKNPDVGKDCTFMKLRIQSLEDTAMPLYATMRVFSDGTGDMLIMPPKQKRLLDPFSDLQDAPELLDTTFSDVRFYANQLPILAQADVVFKIRLKREDVPITKAVLQKRLKAFSSILQEIPALPDEQPLAMLRYKGVSNFSSEDRVFAFLTQISAHEMVQGEVDEESWAPRVSQEFQISLDEARRQVVAWIAQRNEYTLAVPETRDYILNKNPGVDIAIFAQHPTYNFHMYRIQSFRTYTILVNMMGLLMTAPADRFAKVQIEPTAPIAPIAATLQAAITPVVPPASPGIEENSAVFPNDDDIPEFMKGEEDAFFPNNTNIPEFMKTAAPAAPAPAATAAAAAAPAAAAAAATAPAEKPAAIQDEEDAKAAAAFKKPTDLKAIVVKKYYIDKLKIADPDLFNYERKDSSERGYVSHCAANESRQPIVLDKDEYREMRTIYDDDEDLAFIVYPDDSSPAKFQKKQPNKDENAIGKLEGREYPTEAEKEIITLVRYGSKAKRINYYFCPRLFCIRDRLMLRYKDFKATVDRKGQPKPANTCPFCRGTPVNMDLTKEKDRDPNMTVLERKTRPGSISERQIYIGFLSNKRTPSGLSLPCCFADPSERFDRNNPEFVRLGLRPARAQPIADLIMGAPVLPQVQGEVQGEVQGQVQGEVQGQEAPEVPESSEPGYKYEPNYYRVIQGVSVKSIVDATRIPLEIVVPKQSAAEDPKAGPQVGLLPEALDTYFAQDSTSDKFAGRLEIVRKLKPTAKGFLRLAVDNTLQNRQQSFLSAIAPFLGWQSTAEKVVEAVLDPRIPPKQFLQLNGGNLVHEFFNKCDKKHQNDMRSWVSRYVGIDELKSSNIPAIERLMNSYECFKAYLNDPTQRKDPRVLYQALSEPGVLMGRGVLFLILEVTLEDVTVKVGDKTEYKRLIKFDRVRCPPYPLSEGQQKADIGFIVHYSEILHDRYTREKSYRHLAWEPLFYVDGNIPTPESRHKPTLFFQRSQEASWPPIVQQRVSEFFYSCASLNTRGPFTSQFGMDPNALISAQEIITGVRIQPNGIIRDSYNHLAGVAYRMAGKSEIIAVPVADDGSIHFERRLFLDWDDFQPAPVDACIDFYTYTIINVFPQYKGYMPKYIQKSRDTQEIVGLTLQNGFSIPAGPPKDARAIADMRIVEVDDLEWDINRTIAYDAAFRRKAFLNADEPDTKEKDYVQLTASNLQDELEDVYQHLRLTFSSWLSTGAGRDIREALGDTLKTTLPLNEKRKRLDILLEDKVTKWLEPTSKLDTGLDEIGFLRVDCTVQEQADCKGRCAWSSDTSTCKIHTPAQISPNKDVILQVPRLLYLRLVDELIRYASRREEIFARQVPRLTIRKEAQRKGDQYIIAEGSPDWNAWWELLRIEWMPVEKEGVKFFDEQYEPTPSGMPTVDTRTLPPILKESLGAADPKTGRLVWNPSSTDQQPFLFLKSVLRNHPITVKKEPVLDLEELSEIVKAANVQILYMPTGKIAGSLRKKAMGATDAIVIAIVDGTVGWVSQHGTFGVKIPLIALPDSLGIYRLK